MRTSIVLSFLLAMTAPGCGLVLDLDSLQGGDAGARDGSVADAGDAGRDAGRDAAIDANLPDTNLPDTNPPPDANDVDANVPDVGVPDDTGTDGGQDVGNDGGTDGGNDGGTDGGNDAGNDGGSDAGRDAGGATVGVSGTVVGLPTGVSISVGNGSDTQSLTGAGGSTPFTFRVVPGATYAVTVTAPPTLLCLVYRGAGTASADVTNVFVGCSTAVDLVSFFPFDGDVHAGRGTDWTTISGSVGYVTDRIGRPSHALAPTSGTTIRLMRPLNGDSLMVAAHATQFTISMWVSIPAAAPSTTGSLMGHGGPTALSASAQINFRGGQPFADLYFYWDGGFDRAVTMSTTPLGRDTWHHIVVSASGPSSSAVFDFDRHVYVDGVLEGSITTCCGWGNSTSWWELDTDPYLRDDVRLYSRMLTNAEVAGIYAAEHVP